MHVSRRGHAPPPSTRHSTRRLRWRNRWVRAAVWVFLVFFVLSVVGIAVVTFRSPR
jgi:hypothetical protein